MATFNVRQIRAAANQSMGYCTGCCAFTRELTEPARLLNQEK